MTRRWSRPLALASGALLLGCPLPGCGLGSVGLGAAVGGGGGTGDVPPGLSALEVRSRRESPARISFLLVDDTDAVPVELWFRTGDCAGGVLAEDRLLGAWTLAASPAGVEHCLPWNFTDDLPELLQEGALVAPVLVYARLPGVLAGPQPGLNAACVELGDEPPAIEILSQTTEEVAGIAVIRFRVTDSTADPVDVSIEFGIVGADGTVAEYRPARPALAEETPEVAFPNLPSDGQDRQFAWDTRAEPELQESQEEVELRLTAVERLASEPCPGEAGVPAASAGLEAQPVVSARFVVDNNEPPTLQVDWPAILFSPDRRRGVPIPLSVADPEGDEVRVALQWRRAGESFVPLGGGTVEEIEAILADPELRRAHRLGSAFPVWVGGTAEPCGADCLQLPGWADEVSVLLGEGLEGRVLEVLRPPVGRAAVPAPAGGWGAGGPVASAPIADGLEAVVLTGAGAGWTLRRVELATGVACSGWSAAGPGAPLTLAPALDGASVVVAAAAGGGWQLYRVELPNGPCVAGTPPVTPLIEGPGTELRALLSLGAGRTLVAVDDRLLLASHFGTPEDGVALLLEGLGEPAGLALDPRLPGRVYVSERAAGRILRLELEHRTTEVLAVEESPGVTLDAPGPLAFDARRARLVVGTSGPAGGALRALSLGGAEAGRLYDVAPELPGVPGHVALGPEGLRLVALPEAGELDLVGGVAQRRSVLSCDTYARRLRVDAPFDPPLGAGTRWRVVHRTRDVVPTAASGAAAQGVWSWDSGEVPGGEQVFLRVLAFDRDVGQVDETLVGKLLTDDYAQGDPVALGVAGEVETPLAVAVVDFDADEDPDLVSCNLLSGSLTAFQQLAPGAFDPLPIPLALDGFAPDPRALVATDLDGEPPVDLVVADSASGRVGVLLRAGSARPASSLLPLSSPSLPPPPSLLAQDTPAPPAIQPVSLAYGDLDGDGWTDLAVGDSSGRVLIYLQEGAGAFIKKPGLTPLPSPDLASQARALATGDIDGDGDLDLAVALEEAHLVALYLQQGAGLFADAPLLLGGPDVTRSPLAVAVADLDGDGRLDVVTRDGPSAAEQALVVFFQTGPLSFDPSAAAEVGRGIVSDPTALAAADADGDGDLDLLCASAQEVQRFTQLAPRQFDSRPATVLASGEDPMVARFLALAARDVDGDGPLDVFSTLSGNPAEERLRGVLPRPGSGFDAAPLAIGAELGGTPRSLAAADLDGDGDLDLAVGLSRSGANGGDAIALLLQGAPGDLAAGLELLEAPGLLEEPQVLRILDLDGDGSLDLLAANVGLFDGSSFFGNVLLFRRVAGGPWEVTELVSPATLSGNRPRDLELADVDGDGALDLVIAVQEVDVQALFVLRGSPPGMDGLPAAPYELLPAIPASAPSLVELADLDGDGDLDLIAGGVGAQVIFQVAPGVFGPAVSLLTGQVVQGLLVTDLDRDSDPDVAVALQNDRVSVFLNDGAGGFAQLLDGLAVGLAPRAVRAGDMDADGAPDLIALTTNPRALAVLRQSRPGSFAPTPLLVGEGDFPATPTELLAVDFDGDGDRDLAASGSFGLLVFWNSH